MTWTPAKVGCYWNSGPYHIGTFQTIEDGRIMGSGYRLSVNGKRLGEFYTLAMAQRRAEIHRMAA